MDVVRLGTRYGGWVIPRGLLASDAICYCAGAGEDVSFDLGLIEQYGCHVHVFDPTPRAIAHVHSLRESLRVGIPVAVNNDPRETYRTRCDLVEEKLHFHAYGLYGHNQHLRFYSPQDPGDVSHSVENLQGTDRYFEAECRTVSSIMRELGHPRLDLLKLDIEGAELSVLKSMMRAGVRPRILCVEFDLMRCPRPNENSAQVVRQLVRFGYDIAHMEQWNVTFVERNVRPRAKTIAKLLRLA